MPPVDYKALGKHVASSVGFVSNIIYWRESGYFDVASKEKWLLHTWSLSVEWQFYILYPMVLIALKRFLTLENLKKTILIATGLSFVFSVIATYKLPGGAYYLFPARVWEMLLGGIAYIYPFNLSKKQSKTAEILGFAFILASYIFISKENIWPGYLATLPVFGAFFIIQAQRNDSLLTGNIVFQKIGKWSYSTYLWHWPVVVALYYFSIENFALPGIAISLFLGWLSYLLIESKKFPSFDKWKDIFRVKPIWMVIVIGIMGSFLFYKQGFDKTIRYGANTDTDIFLNYYQKMHESDEFRVKYWLQCDAYWLRKEGKEGYAPSCTASQKGGVLIWGDSHSQAVAIGVRDILKGKSIPYSQITSSGCKASLHKSKMKDLLFQIPCDYANKIALETIKKVQPKLIVIAQANSHEDTDWLELFSKIKSLSPLTKVLMIGPIQQWQPSLPKILIKSEHWKKLDRRITDPGMDLKIFATDKVLHEINFPESFTYYSLIDHLCDIKGGKMYCLAQLEDGMLLQVDYAHMTLEGSVFVVNNYLKETIMKLLSEN